jgi:formate dehydrogenase subunit gamma
MTEPGGRGWRDEDSRGLADRLAKRLTEVIGEEASGKLDESQVSRLKATLETELEREASKATRRTVRAFMEEERLEGRRLAKERAKAAQERPMVERLSLHQRIQHIILFSSTILLIITGLPIKFHEAAVAAAIINLMGGPEVTRFLHRIGAVGLTAIGLYHIYYCVAYAEGRRTFTKLIPKLQDAKDALHQIGYFLGLKKDKPLYGRFSYIEKFDYWAVYWGMVVMITSGYILWFKDIALNHFGKFAFDIGREAHSDEALLATLAIVIWHFYNVHFNPHKFPGSLTWWHGKISVEEFREEHPLEYEEWVQAGKIGERTAEHADEGEVRP